MANQPSTPESSQKGITRTRNAVLGMLFAVQLQAQIAVHQTADGMTRLLGLADLIESSARLWEQIERLRKVEGSRMLSQSPVDRLNLFRIAEGLVGVSGEAIKAVLAADVAVLDLHERIHELRNAGIHGRASVVVCRQGRRTAPVCAQPVRFVRSSPGGVSHSIRLTILPTFSSLSNTKAICSSVCVAM